MNTNEKNLLLNNSLILEQVCSALPLGVMISNMDGIAYFKNKIFSRWLAEYPVDNKLWFLQMQPYIDQESSPELKEKSINWLIENSAVNDTELVVVWQDQKHFFRIRTSPLLNEDNQICGLIEITENITDKIQLEKSLQHSRRFETVGRLASGIAHDFNNILQVINGHSEMLLESRKDDAKLSKSLDVILTSGQKASALTRQLLLFSRRQQNEFTQINFKVLIGNMQKILSRMLGEDIEMTFCCDDCGATIDGDESQIEQIVMNLAINARDAMPDGGKIEITVDVCDIDEKTLQSIPFGKPGKHLCVNFSDTGCGIPKDVIDHIFEPFFTTKEAGRGTGLGLATVYSIIKQHQGFIKVDSVPNKGTSFKMYFPISCNQKQADASVAEAKQVSEGSKEKVLIIEDDELVRDLASQVLTHYGYTVLCASNISQANTLLRSERFDLFLIDIVLPDGNGVDFVETIKDDHKDAAFILSSGYTEDKPQVKQTINKGYSFLHKPYTINSLLTACSDALKKVKKYQ